MTKRPRSEPLAQLAKPMSQAGSKPKRGVRGLSLRDLGIGFMDGCEVLSH